MRSGVESGCYDPESATNPGLVCGVGPLLLGAVFAAGWGASSCGTTSI